MKLNFKLFFKYILLNMDHIFFNLKFKNYKNSSILLPLNAFYYLILHIKLSTIFYSTQLMEIFAYEIPNFFKNLGTTKTHFFVNTNIIVFNFHSIFNNRRFFIFLTDNSFNFFWKKNTNKITNIHSITELFLNANWLEREVSELSGLFFFNKKDVRNLMLQYGDTSAPFQKSFPSIGIKEIFYDTINDVLIQQAISVQF